MNGEELKKALKNVPDDFIIIGTENIYYELRLTELENAIVKLGAELRKLQKSRTANEREYTPEIREILTFLGITQASLELTLREQKKNGINSKSVNRTEAKIEIINEIIEKINQIQKRKR